MKYCPQCGSQNADDHRFCLSCGAALDGSDEWKNTVPVNPSNQNQIPPDIQPEPNYGSYNGTPNQYSGMQSGGSYQNDGSYSGGNPNPAPYGSPVYGQNSQYGSSSYQQPGQKNSKRGRKQKKNQAANPYSTSTYGSQPLKKKKGRTGLIIGIVAALVIAGGAGGYLLYSRNKNGDSSRSADAVLEDPADLDLSIAAYQRFVDNGQYEEAYQIEQNAADAMSEDDYSQFMETVDEIDQENNLTTMDSGKRQYEIIADLGSLDSIPFGIADEVWMIKKDGRFSYVGPDGKNVNRSDGAKGRVYRRSYSPSGPMSYGCIADEGFYNAEDRNVFPLTPDMEEGMRCGLMHGVAEPWGYLLKEDGTVELQKAYDDASSNRFPYDEPNQDDELLFVGTDFHDSYQPYIYNPKTETVYGPYSKDNPGSISQVLNDQDDDLTFDDDSVYGLLNYSVIGPFWTQDEDQFVLHSEDDEQQISGIDEVKLIDYTAAGAIKDSHLTVYDKNLNPIYSGCFESGAAPIGSVIPVQIDGTWYLINTEPYVEGPRSTDSTPSIELAAGTYMNCPESDLKEIQFTIREDATFSCRMVTDKPYRNGYKDDSHYFQYDANGVLLTKGAADGTMQFVVCSLKTGEWSDYDGKTKDGRSLMQWSNTDLFNGRNILFYPKDTSWDKLDSVTQEQLLRMEPPVSEGELLPANVIRINGTEFTLMQDSAQ